MSLTRGLVLDVANQLGGAMPGVAVLHDFSREKNDGAMTNVTWVQIASTGQWVMVCNGTSNRVTITDHPSLDMTEAITIESWLLPTRVGNNNGTFTSHRQAWMANVPFDLRCPTNDVNERLTGFIHDGVANDTALSANFSVTWGIWMHVVFVFDRVSMRWYINGVLSGVPTVRPEPMPISTTDVQVTSNWPSGEYFEGQQAKCRILNYAFSPAQIRARYHSTKWLFGEAS